MEIIDILIHPFLVSYLLIPSRPRVAVWVAAKEYIHRLGRTGRAGAKGQGLLLLHEFERGAEKRER